MSTLLIAQNETVESGTFMGDALCSLKTAYLFVQNASDVDRVVMSVSPGNALHFLWERFCCDPRGDGTMPPVELVWDEWDAGNWSQRWETWDRWRAERSISSISFDHYRELYLRIHGAQRQTAICGSERGLNRRNIYEYWLAGQEDKSDSWAGSAWFGEGLVDHPPLTHERDVYISPHCKTQGNYVFTFDFWAEVVRRLLVMDVTVTVGFDGYFYDQEFAVHPNYRKHWGDYRAWMDQVCRHKLVACGNTGTGWLAAACGVPMVTMEPHGSVMADHRYRECGLQNIVEVVDGARLDELCNDMNTVAAYTAHRIEEEVHRRVVMTTGCYDVLHAGHVRHLERSRALGTKLIVALNSDDSVRLLKGFNVGSERPINPHGQRKAVLEALRCVDEVQVFDGRDAMDLIREIKPDVLTAGFGYTPDRIVGRDIVEGYGGRVVVTCTGDAKSEPSTTKILRRVRAADVGSAVRAASPYTVNPPEKLRFLAEQWLAVALAGVTGLIADLGTCRGGTGLLLRQLAPDRGLHLFDTWAGNPHDDPLCHHRRGEWACMLDDCQRVVGDGPLTHYHRGVFPQSALGLEDVAFALVYVDADTYQSTRDAIAWFWPSIAPGGRIVIDDYGWEPCAGVKAAVDEAFPSDSGNTVGDWNRTVVGQLYTCVLEKR